MRHFNGKKNVKVEFKVLQAEATALTASIRKSVSREKKAEGKLRQGGYFFFLPWLCDFHGLPPFSTLSTRKYEGMNGRLQES